MTEVLQEEKIEKMLAFAKNEISAFVAENNKPFTTIRYHDDDSYSVKDWDALIQRVKLFVVKNGYHNTYIFWTDGSNMLSEDHIRIRQKETPRQNGWGWGSPDWDDLNLLESTFAAGSNNVICEHFQ